MPPMRTVLLLISSFAVACGPSYTQTVKTPDELVAEQEALGASQEKNKNQYDTGSGGELDSEKRKMFDERLADIEINRAVRSAETCPGVVEAGPYGEAGVSITFISMAPSLQMFMTPVIGLICFGIILLNWFGGVKYGKIPAGLVKTIRAYLGVAH